MARCAAARPAAPSRSPDHPEHDGRDDERDRFVMLAVRHTARNNLSADQRAQVQGLGAAIEQINARIEAGHTAHRLFGRAPVRNASGAANATEAPLYECRITAQRAAVPVRLGALDSRGLPDPRIHARPSVHGVQTAIVVGTSGQPIHTDRDHRIKVQFHWQRGANASHRLDHPSSTDASDNAPASDASGTWVRVSQSVAGANWGAVFTPRLGQEVLVQFINGAVDRPVVVGAVYNGQGSVDAQGNQNAAGAASATGNAQAWFPGSKEDGELQGHARPAEGLQPSSPARDQSPWPCGTVSAEGVVEYNVRPTSPTRRTPLRLWITLWATGRDSSRGPEFAGPGTHCSMFRQTKYLGNQQLACL